MLLQMQEEQGTPPPALERRPQLSRYQYWLSEEFTKLSRDRSYTEAGPMALSTGIIRTYYDAFDMGYYDFDNFHLWMTRIDDIWLERVTEKREKDLASKKSRPGNAPPKANPR